MSKETTRKRTPEEWARFVAYTCEQISPCKGYTMSQYNSFYRLEKIAGMVEALKLNTNYRDELQLMNKDTFDETRSILEWDNYHTENIAFCLAFGDAAAIVEALQTVHYMGQSHAIDNKLSRPEITR